jgi:hypothetical protein
MSPPNIAARGWPQLLANLLAIGVSIATACAAGCGGSDRAEPDAGPACVPPPGNTAPTYTELFNRYFAPGTTGHCANDACHNGPNFNIWMCGLTKDSCYRGMSTMAGLINTGNPTASLIGDTRNSPLSWINPNGPMPFDTPGPFPEGRDAILAWVAACAQNN